MRHRHPVDQVVGGAARGQQCHHGIDDGLFIHHQANRRKPFALDDAQCRARGFPRQLVAQRTARGYEGGAWHVQAHGFEQHLVAVGGAIKRAGAWCVVAFHL